jgi:hypothetical protein
MQIPPIDIAEDVALLHILEIIILKLVKMTV